MLMTILKYFYAINATLLAISIIYGKMFVFRKKDAMFVSNYCAGIAAFMGIYILLSLLYAGLLSGALHKGIMLLFAFSPFILGLSAKYHTEKYFTAVQILLIALSITYIL